MLESTLSTFVQFDQAKLAPSSLYQSSDGSSIPFCKEVQKSVSNAQALDAMEKVKSTETKQSLQLNLKKVWSRGRWVPYSMG